MNDITKRFDKLRDKERAQPFGILTKEEQQMLEVAGPKNCLCYDGAWLAQGSKRFRIPIASVLNPEYKLKPEYIEIEIEVVYGKMKLVAPAPNANYSYISDIVEDENFVCFHDPFGMETTNAGDIPGWMRTLAIQDGDFKVHARFLQSKP